tara:strand:- start:5574 stop:6323 length:750 start_codon:yes stop_codon:yes gene_type:complete
MKNTKPLISIVITYFKKRKYIKQTLDSISNQTYKNYEIIFIYDDINREDHNFIKNLLSKFKKKKLIFNKFNLGAANSRNKGINLSKGSYIAFIDSDDTWKKNKLKEQLDYMKKNQYHFCFTSYEVIDENNRVIKKKRVLSDAFYLDLYNSNFIGLSTVMIDKKIINRMRFPNLKTQEDFALWLFLLRKGFKLRHFKRNLSTWRKTKNSLSSNIIQKLQDAFKLYYFYENKNFIFAIYSVMVLSYNKLIK